jgi:hypothetical protein
MDATAVAAIAAVVTLPLGLVQWRSTRAQARSAEVDLLREMRADWLELKSQWHKALLTAIGPDSYYSPASMEIRETFRKLIEDIQSIPDVEDPGWHAHLNNTRDRSHEFEQAERDVLFFLATLASVVLTGRLSPSLAYTVIGPDVVRRSRQIRVLLGAAKPDWYSLDRAEEKEEQSESSTGELTDEEDAVALVKEIEEDDGEDQECPWVYWVDSLPGLTDRILGLMDVLWAEGVRRYDLETHDLVAGASVKYDTQSGLRNRLRIRRLCREHGSRFTNWRLERSLLVSEFLPIGPPRRVDFISLQVVPDHLQGWGIRGWVRRNRAFIKGRFKRSRRSLALEMPVDPVAVGRSPGESPFVGF